VSKIWFITGASSGIGAGIANAALRAGDSVVATARNLDKAKNALGDEHGDRLLVIPLDVTHRAQTREAVTEAVARFGRIDVLVNNAGYVLLGNFENTSVDEIEAQFATNFYGVVHVLQAVLPVMRKQRAGHILNIGASGGVTGLRQAGPYCATKFAMEGLAFSLAQEVAPFGIKLTTVEPGAFRTDLLDGGNVRYVGESRTADYAADSSPQVTWGPYHGVQPGDPDRLGDALLKIVSLEAPPQTFIAGSDALAMITPVLEARLSDLRKFEALSGSTDGSF
jgi:NAD(P)-dependent dehydrogenase (short-subunit alcohol dehydrogenase family)